MNPYHYGIVVGIDHYPGIRPLNFARQDAQAFYAWLTAPGKGGVPDTNVEKIVVDGAAFTSADGAEPNRDLVNRAFIKVHAAIRKAVAKDPTAWNASRLYVYFAGHGISPHATETAVLMANASDKPPESNLGENIACLLYADYYTESTDFRELLLLADCCRSRRADAPGGGPPFTKIAKNNGSVVRVIGFATQYQNLAYEPIGPDADVARGYYTRALLEGLEGAAPDPAHNNDVTSNSLQDYVRQRVTSLTDGKPYAQVPAMYADPGARIVLRKATPRPTRRVRISFPVGYTSKATLYDSAGNEIDSHDAGTGAWDVDLVDGLYEIRPDAGAPAVAFNNQGLMKVVGPANGGGGATDVRL